MWIVIWMLAAAGPALDGCEDREAAEAALTAIEAANREVEQRVAARDIAPRRGHACRLVHTPLDPRAKP